MALSLFCALPSVAAPCTNGLYVRLQEGGRVPLPTEASGLGIRHVFVYGPRVGQDPADAAAVTERVRATLHGARVTAVLGRRVCSKGSTGRCLDMADEPTRRRLSSQATRLWQSGYDGVQFDLEPVENDDRNFIDLLRATRFAKPSDKLLSIAGYSLELTGGAELQWPQKPRAGGSVVHWSAPYYSEVMRYVDQVMVMNYDTAVWNAKDFHRFTSWQAQHFLEIRPAGLELQFGLPSDVSGRTGYYDRRAENLAVGSDALRETFGAARSCPPEAGVTIFTAQGMNAMTWSEFRHRFGSAEQPSSRD